MITNINNANPLPMRCCSEPCQSQPFCSHSPHSNLPLKLKSIFSSLPLGPSTGPPVIERLYNDPPLHWHCLVNSAHCLSVCLLLYILWPYWKIADLPVGYCISVLVCKLVCVLLCYCVHLLVCLFVSVLVC